MQLSPRAPVNLGSALKYKSPYAVKETRCDEGYFGPGSVTWKVTTSPALLPATAWAGLMLSMDPVMAVLGDTSDAFSDPIGRGLRTFDYTFMLTLGDTQHADRAAKRVNLIHDKVVGSYLGMDYCASQPEHLLWAHMSAGMGMIRSYNTYMPKRLTTDEQDRFWQEWVVAAVLNRVPEDMIPKSQAEAEAFFAERRPRLAVLEITREAVGLTDWSLRGNEMVPFPLNLPTAAFMELVIAILPDYVLTLIAKERPRLWKKAIITAARPLFAAASVPVVRDSVPMMVSDTSRALAQQARASEKHAASLRSVETPIEHAA